MSDSVQPHRQQPTRLPHPWDSPGKDTGVGRHFLLQCMKVKSESEVAQPCPTLSDPMDCSPPGSSVHGIFQARVLERGAVAFSIGDRIKCIKDAWILHSALHKAGSYYQRTSWPSSLVWEVWSEMRGLLSLLWIIRAGVRLFFLLLLHSCNIGYYASFRIVSLHHSFSKWDKWITFSFLLWSHSSGITWFDVSILVWFCKVL